ncbi:DMT family transporter [Labrys wisconsinensis]|uniref:Drug/metabolite transporter (DMT)-like permease n=1 Tax=Labrys wisconsinensis TaxID=425677 RepID=A0ABU0J9V1_9HYPH|nr:DMT family transporter [Labrys wisconsinensis]MDQ0471042.1 drug/metabolite transporter (DMT)-like permease [Labrys wisconsinensis]
MERHLELRSPGWAASSGHFAAMFSFGIAPIGFLVQKSLTESISVLHILSVQLGCSAIVLWLISFMLWKEGSIAPGALAKGLGLGLLQPGVVLLLNVAGAARLDSVTLVLLWALQPPATAFVGVILLGERPPSTLKYGLAVSFAGLVLLAVQRNPVGANQAAGFALVLAAIACAAVGPAISRHLNTVVLPWHRAASLQVTGGALLTGLGLVLVGDVSGLPALPGLWPSFAFLIFVSSAASYLAYSFALSRIDVAWVSLYAAVGPGLGAIVAVAVSGRAPGPVEAAGISVVVAGSVIPHLGKRADARQGRGTAMAGSLRRVGIEADRGKC